MKFITFESYLKNKGVELNPWQRLAAQRFLDVVRHHGEAKSGKSFLVKELAEFINEHGNAFDVEGEIFSEQIEGIIDEIRPIMSTEDCVKVWLSLREERLSLSVGAPGCLPAMEAKLYDNLTERLFLESQEVIFVGENLTEGDQHEETVMKG